MPDFPSALYDPRTLVNIPGVTFDVAQTKRLYAEDLNSANDEIVAIETILGLNPEGAATTVSDRIQALEDAPGGGGVWGAISGTIGSQTDLMNQFSLVRSGAIDLTFPRGFFSNLSTGDVDLYTVPAGRKAFIGPSARGINKSAGNITSFLQVKISGTYYRLTTAVTAASGASMSISLFAGMILNAGESIAINNATNSGLNIGLSIFEFDDSSPLVRASIFGLASGNQTLYTCPASTIPFAFSDIMAYTHSPISCPVFNGSGGSLNYYLNNVSSGGSPSSSNQITPSIAISNNSVDIPNLYGSLTPGDFINVNSSGGGAGQNIWLNLYEYPI
jgi:hypothetical protein